MLWGGSAPHYYNHNCFIYGNNSSHGKNMAQELPTPAYQQEVNLGEFNSLNAVLKWVCERYPELPAFSNQGATITYRRLDALSRSFAAYFRGRASRHIQGGASLPS